jgi:small-conductance mechanosensitive channel
MITGVGALLILVTNSQIVHQPIHRLSARLTLGGLTLGFALLAIICVRSTAQELDELIRWRGGKTAGSAMHMVVSAIGYLLAVLCALDMMSAPIGHLLLGGAIIGILIGIAAQQSLGNLFAGMVLLVARPFAVGNHIRIRSGALGGEFYGTVLAMSLTYVSILTNEGLLKVPNASVLASAVGPWNPRTDEPAEPVDVEFDQRAAPQSSGR